MAAFSSNPLSLSVPEAEFESWLRDSGYLEILDQRTSDLHALSSSSSSPTPSSTNRPASTADDSSASTTANSATAFFVSFLSQAEILLSLFTLNPIAKLTTDDFSGDTPSWTHGFIGYSDSYSFPSSISQARMRLHENVKRYARNYASLLILFFACSLYQIPLALVGLVSCLALWDAFRFCGARWGLDNYPVFQRSLVLIAQLGSTTKADQSGSGPMASHRSSSSKKRKSSKRKSSKVPSEDRHKKRSKKTKSRKLRHSDESSYSSDDSVSISSSHSEDEYSRSRSHTRSKVKGKRKRSERSSSKHRSSKKKKKSRRSVDSDERKKTRKKKGRRELSVSSVSSDSQDGSKSGESEVSPHRGRSGGKVEDDRDTGNLKSGVSRDESRPVSYSPDGRYSQSNDLSSKDTLPADNSSRRLRSVIALVKGREIEVEDGDKGGHKEEIAYDYDEYPPSKSNDSYDYVSKEFSHQTQVDSESRRVEHPVGEETLEPNTNAKLTGDRDEKFPSAGGHSSIEENKGEVSSPMSSSTADDLESILRLKALENLKKYRGGVKNSNLPVDAKKNNASDVKQLPAANIEYDSNKPHDMNVSGVAGATRLPDENRSPIVRRKSDISDGKVQFEKGKVIVPGNVSRPPTSVSISDNAKASDLPSTRKPEISSLTSRRKSSSTHEDNKLVTESTAGKDAPESPLGVGQTSHKIDSGVNDSPRPTSISEPLTLLKPTLEEESSKEPPPGEDKEGSQFQQKTMSVVRGSETVQVSYKVYIPKKTPALARRLLRR